MRSASTFRSGIAEDALGNGTLGRGLGDPRQAVFIHAKLRQGVDQVALLLAQVPAPNHRQQLPLADPLTETNRRRTAVARPQFDNLARKAGMHVREAIGIEHQRARHFQHHRRRGVFDLAGLDAEVRGQLGRQADRILSGGKLHDRVGLPAGGVGGRQGIASAVAQETPPHSDGQNDDDQGIFCEMSGGNGHKSTPDWANMDIQAYLLNAAGVKYYEFEDSNNQ